MLKKLIKFLLITTLITSLTACGQSKEGPNTIKVGTVAGPETQLMQVAKSVAKKKYGLDVKIVVFSDYNTPNVALSDGSIDANMFQHAPYLKSQIKSRGYKLSAVGKVFIYPMAIYSQKIKKLSELKAGDKVAIPDDPSNEARALLLLQKAKLIKLKPGIGINATTLDVVNNPLKLKFLELDAAELPRSLADVTIAAINTNYAVPAGLIKKHESLFREDKDSPYANVVVVQTKKKNDPKFKELVAALHSKAVLRKAHALFGSQAIPAWK